LTDIKTFEQHRVWFAITTANTIQTENHFYPFNGLKLLLYCVLSKNYSKLSHKAVKIGIVLSLAYLQEIVLALKGFRQKQGLFGTPF
jgi:hydroxymethylpyrimidine/phosphomethylpyrimidine kinase